jgi:hypothetical protein
MRTLDPLENCLQDVFGRPSAQEERQPARDMVAAGYFSAAFATAFVLPEKFQEMQWIVPLIELTRQWLPGIVRIAAHARQPELVEAYLVLGLALCLPSLLTYVLSLPRGSSLKPLESWLVKLLGLVMCSLFAVVASAVWWNPAVSEFCMRFADSCFGSFMDARLSARLGMAVLLNLFYCLGPFLSFSFIWRFMGRPVQQL